MGNHGGQLSPNDLANDSTLSKIGEFKYGGWGFDWEGLKNFVNKNPSSSNRVLRPIQPILRGVR